MNLADGIQMDWKEGIEILVANTKDQMWAKLGLAEKRLPFFQQWTDLDGTIDPWSEEGQG